MLIIPEGGAPGWASVSKGLNINMEKGPLVHQEAKEASRGRWRLILVLKSKSQLDGEKRGTTTEKGKAQTKGRNYSERANHLP